MNGAGQPFDDGRHPGVAGAGENHQEDRLHGLGGLRRYCMTMRGAPASRLDLTAAIAAQTWAAMSR